MKDQQPPKDKVKKVSARRQAILAGAFAQLRKSRAKIEPAILQKIRDIVGGSPEIMQKLGVTEAPKPQKEKSGDAGMPLSKGQIFETAPQKKPNNVPKKKADAPKSKGGYEEIDQGKNMEIMAKLMELSPDNRDNIKAVIKKNQK